MSKTKTKTMGTKTDYYCNQKFWWLTVEPQRKVIQSCCSAAPSKVDLSWLEENPGKLFNSPGLLHERQAMLENIPVVGCQTCWRAESAGIPSRRTIYQSQRRTHTELESKPEVININLGNDCNLTCSYCCKQYSSAWLRDITSNSEYLHEERYIINAEDKLISALGQKTVKNSKHYQTLINEVKTFTECGQVVISGGEPFLYNGLEDLVASFNGEVEIFTGLGVDSVRFKRMVDKLPQNVTFTVSAESTGALYEFNRYGNTWENFQSNLDIIANRQYRFCSVISNTTVHGYADFVAEYGTVHDQINICTDPDYLGPNVIDSTTKQALKLDGDILTATTPTPTVEQVNKAKIYINEFARRRNLNLNIFPESFQEWLNEEVLPH